MKPQPEALSKILIIQNMLTSFTSPVEMFSFICKGLEDIPGVSRASSVLDGENHSPKADGEEVYDFHIRKHDHTFGTLFCYAGDPDSFSLYAPFVNNICFMVASILEERRLLAENAEYSRNLESMVQERTRELEAAKNNVEILLREVYHRTKNNMYMINNLLEMQAMKLDNPALEAPFNTISQRILAMALVHNKLYKKHDMSRIDFMDYLRELSENILSGSDDEPNSIELTLEGGPLDLGVGTAIPCGLVLNELITNSVTHAFAGEKPRRIQIHIDKIDDTIVVSYRDNGRGLPRDYTLDDSSGLGMQIIFNIIQVQLQGQVELMPANGFSVLLSFRERENE